MGRISDDVIGQVLDRVNIAELIGHYVPLKMAGRNLKGLCPFHHEKTPSFVVTPDKQIFHCFGCGVGGNAVSFIMKMEHLEFPQAVKFLAEKVGVLIVEDEKDSFQQNIRQQIFKANEEAVSFFHTQLIVSKSQGAQKAREYLKSRGISLACVKEFQLGYAPDEWDALLKILRLKNFTHETIEKSGLMVARQDGKGVYDRFRGRVIFPIFDYRSRAVAFGARSIQKEEKVKYINSSETPVYIKGEHLYGIHMAKDSIVEQDVVIVVEGYMDFIRVFFSGIKYVVASLGTALTVQQIRLIRRYTHNVIMLYDMDAAGQSATLRSLDLFLEEDMNVRIATLSAGEDPDSFIQKYGIDPFKDCLKKANHFFDFKLTMLLNQYGSTTPESRASVCREMIMSFEKIKSEVVKDGYYRTLAVRLNLPIDVVLNERLRIGTTHRSSYVEPVKKPLKKEKLRSYEETLLSMMLKDLRWVIEGQKVLTKEDFMHPIAKNIVTLLFRLYEEKGEIHTAHLYEQLIHEEEKQLVTHLISLPQQMKMEDEGRIFEDCLKRMCDATLKIRRNELRDEMRRAEAENNQEALLLLKKEFNQLIKRVVR